VYAEGSNSKISRGGNIACSYKEDTNTSHSRGWIGARKKILSTLVDLLHGHLDSIRIPSSELFNKDTLPDTITLIGLSKGVWNNPDQQYTYQGTEVYYLRVAKK
jgi:hypothetical protein